MENTGLYYIKRRTGEEKAFDCLTNNAKKISVYGRNSEVMSNEIKKYQAFQLQMLQRSRD